jgi:excisionase family DNA binding protein
MEVRELYSITEARKLLGGISRNSIYALLNSGTLPSVVVRHRHRRFISAAAISKFIEASSSTVAPSKDPLRDRRFS